MKHLSKQENRAKKVSNQKHIDKTQVSQNSNKQKN